jgi:hypothetical protein
VSTKNGIDRIIPGKFIRIAQIVRVIEVGDKITNWIVSKTNVLLIFAVTEVGIGIVADI